MPPGRRGRRDAPPGLGMCHAPPVAPAPVVSPHTARAAGASRGASGEVPSLAAGPDARCRPGLGGALWWRAWARAGCAQERLAPRCHHRAPRLALRGADVPASDEHALRLAHSSATAHRPDVPQAV
jgi:hypothetical protein